MSIERPPFNTALGISTGDIVTTSYGTGPYEVWSIWGPRLWFADYSSIVIYPAPTISLTLIDEGHVGPVQEWHLSWINQIRRVGDRWFNHSAEIFVRAGSVEKPVQSTFFDSPHLATDDCDPYPFQEGVNYDADRVWRCEIGHDYDSTQVSEPGEDGRYAGRYHPTCPKCGGWPRPILRIGPSESAAIARINLQGATK